MTANHMRARILAVDDDPGILRVIARAFGQHHEVVCHESATAALAASLAHVPDVAIVDIRMPEMNGFELMTRLHAAIGDLDVILMTGNAEEPDANLVRAIDAGAFYFIQKPFERRVLLALVARCLELRRLRREEQRRVRQLEQELEEARRFQISLLPPQEASHGGVAFSARYVPCRELAGDFYDYAVADDGAVAMLIADVVGHGASAAMMTGIVKSAFHAARMDSYDPLCVIDRVKDGLQAFDAGRFITLCTARLEPPVGKHGDMAQTANPVRRLTYANAGHPAPMLRRRSSTQMLESTGPLICSALADIPCGRETFELQCGDLMLFYTDGITEAHGPGGLFGHERLCHRFVQTDRRGAALLDQVLGDVAEFSSGRQIQDDMTLLAAEVC